MITFDAFQREDSFCSAQCKLLDRQELRMFRHKKSLSFLRSFSFGWKTGLEPATS